MEVCVNTRLAFDTKILLNDNKNEKVLFDLYIDGKKKKKKKKKILSKILKMDENNQYGQPMTKPLLYGCVKKKKILLALQNLIILDGLSHENIIGHLFIVDIKFKNINPKTLFIELYPPIFEKKKN